MKALQIVAPGKFEIRDVPIPKPGPGEVLLKVLAVTTCPHWDIHIMGGQPMFSGGTLEYPYTLGQPGHEACGDIVAVGEGVANIGVGERVCAWRDPGHDVQGCYAQYVVKPVEHVIPVPASLPPEACAPLELAMCVSAHMMLAMRLDAITGKRVGVFGLGPAGLVCVQLARAEGAAEIVAFDPLPARREKGRQVGADLVLDPKDAAAVSFPKRGCAGCLDTAFDCVGNPAAVHQAISVTNQLLVLFAVQREPYVFPPAAWAGLVLAGAQAHTREAAEDAAARLAEGDLDLGTLVTDVMRLDDYAEAVDKLKRLDAIKVAFSPQES